MTKWTYMNERVPVDRMIEFLLERGRQGWELCAVRHITQDLYEEPVELIYKKPEG